MNVQHPSIVENILDCVHEIIERERFSGMARLSNFHILCPLIDQSNFLGVVSDSSNDCVVVTLGRNIVIRYKITDRKQVGSWSTREKLTSPVIFDTIGCQYVAVFNHKQIRIWKQEDEDLDAIKKHKLPAPVHTLLVPSGSSAEPAILFQSGRAWKLSTFINAKGKCMEIWEKQERSGINSILREDENLEEWHMITCQTLTYIILSARATLRPKNPTFYLMKLMNEDDDEYSLQRRFTLQIKEAYLVAHTVIQQNGSCSLLTLWSNGKLCRLNLDSYAVEDGSSISISEQSSVMETISPGCVVDSVKELFDLENKVAMVALGPHHIALYGADSSHKGAVVYIVDIHSPVTGELPWEALKESAAMQCLESCNIKDILPRVWNAAGHLFIPSSDGRLVLASYELGSHTPLANLIGCLGKKTSNMKSNGILGHHDQLLHGSWHSSHKSTQLNVKSEGIGKFSWDVDIPLKVHSKLRPLIEKGLPESRICGIIFPELMNEADEESISWCLSHFSDIPEENLVNLLSFFLSREVSTPPKRKVVHAKKAIPFSSPEIPPVVASQNDSSKHLSSIEPMMNGDVNEAMNTTTSDCALEEKKDDFEIGHVFVKGRRRSLRVMRCETPQRELPSSKVGNQEVLKEEINDSLELVDVPTETMANPKYLGSVEKKRNSKIIMNGLDVIQEGEKVFERESCVSEKMEVDASKDLLTSHPEVSDMSEGKIDGNICIEKSWKTEKGVVGIALSSRQRKPVEKLLSVPVSSFILLPALRSKLPFHLALKLIRHVLWLLSSPEAGDCLSDEKLVEWICHLLDAFYQQYTLSQDDDVLDTLKAVKKVLDFQVKLIETLKEMEPLLLQLKSGRIVKEKSSEKWYSIENVRLY